jgi:small subunit ribosomal protein S3
MGQKVNPIGFRLGVIRSWDSKWYVKDKYADYLHEDLTIRKYIQKKLKAAEVGKVEIVRYPERINVSIHTARPGIVIGKKGADVDALKNQIQKLTTQKLHLNIVELRNPSTDANLVSAHVAKQISGRISHKRAMKQAIQNAIKAGAKGIKIIVSGRLAGAEMARIETYKEGRIPLHTLRADVDFGFTESLTTFGKIGIKVWIYKGEVYDKQTK